MRLIIIFGLLLVLILAVGFKDVGIMNCLKYATDGQLYRDCE